LRLIAVATNKSAADSLERENELTYQTESARAHTSTLYCADKIIYLGACLINSSDLINLAQRSILLVRRRLGERFCKRPRAREVERKIIIADEL
jgi:hypothetical protein